MFPSLATMKTMLTGFQCCSLSNNCCIGPSLRSSSQPISIWAFRSVSFTLVVQTSYYHTQSTNFFGFLLVECHVLIHLHALRVALGTRKCKHLPQTSSEVSLSLNGCVAHLFSETMFPRLAAGAAKHFVCFPLI